LGLAVGEPCGRPSLVVARALSALNLAEADLGLAVGELGTGNRATLSERVAALEVGLTGDMLDGKRRNKGN
jgi:hypothetical protein